MLSKLLFLLRYRRRIALATFHNNVFLSRGDVKIIRRQVRSADIGTWYCPWYYYQQQEINFDTALNTPDARAMTVAEVPGLANQERQKKIAQFTATPHSMDIFPIATDAACNKTLILDGNHTLCALFAAGSQENITVDEIVGSNLENVVGDFQIVNR